jgi:uncharacterized protein YukE
VTLTASAGGGGGGWTPPQSLRSWRAQYDPTAGGNFGGDPVVQLAIKQLLGANEGSFAKIESLLVSTAQLADITSQGLSDAKAASWQGNAGDQYRQTLSKLPEDLEKVSDNYRQAYTLVANFADTTFQLKSKYETFEEQLAGLKQQWGAALSQSYPSADVGWAAIHKLQNEISDLCRQAVNILQDSINIQESATGKFGPLTSAAPHEGLLTAVLSPLRDLWDGVTGTWGAIKQFANNPSWSNLANMSGHLALDAGTVVVAAALPEGLGAAGLIDVGADSTVATASAAVGDAAQGAEYASTALNAAGDIGDGNYAGAAFDAWGLGHGIDSEIDDALSDASTLNTYSSDLAAGTVPNLSKDEIAELKELVPDYTNPEAVAEAAADANKDLAQAALLKNPADFLKDHFIEDPAEKALESALGEGGDGNGNGG